MISCVHFKHKIRIVRIFFSEHLFLYTEGWWSCIEVCILLGLYLYIFDIYKNFLIQSVKARENRIL